MPMHFWMATGVTVAVASVMGLGLGQYVTSPQGRSPADLAAAQSVYDDLPMADAGATGVAQDGPAVVRCSGCGPTLAERQWKADMAGLDADGMLYGSSDPVVRDYQAQTIPDDMTTDAITPDAAPSPIHILPPQIARFAAGEAAQPPAVAQAAVESAPPPVVATADEPRL